MHTPSSRTRLLRGLAIGVAAALTASACGGGSASGGEDVVEIGANVELTGNQASIGEPFEKGLELVEDLVNETGFEVDGKTYKLKIRIEDNRSEPQQAVLIQQQFRQDQLPVILGPAASNAFTPAFNAMKGYDHIGMTPAAGAIPALSTPEGKHLFLTHIAEEGEDGRDAQIVRLIADRYKPKKVAILLAQDPNGELFGRAFKAAFEKEDIEIAYEEYFPADTTDFSSYVTALRRLDPDLIVMGYLNTRVAPFLQQAVTAGLTDPVIVSAPGGDAGALEGIENDVNDYVWSVATRSVEDSDDAGITAYREAFEKKFGKAPEGSDFWALTYYDAVLMTIKAMQQAGTVTDVEAISDQLPKVTEWDHAAMPDRRFDAETHFALYTPQIGVFSGGEITYEKAE